MLRRSCLLVLPTLLAAAISLPNPSLAKQPGVSLVLAPDTPNEKSATVWCAYLLARAAYHKEHKLALPNSGPIFPTFNEEVYARISAAQVYDELKEKDTELYDPYWEILSEIKAKGFMNAYVWKYVRELSWCPSQEPKNFSAFQTWSESHLQNHHSLTYGALVVRRK